ncbi:hypothetical protein WJX75_007899 [Coccomyxa subellipsoidea]|uniref:Expansin-like EG45 domain-containing protein n=1 Tax=Coccomyxa subellipsoidea TaxID=248742 RepID=A0ABR2YCH9_9CHLO
MRRLGLLGATLVTLVVSGAAQFSYDALTNQDYLQFGDGTFYGHQQDQDAQGACSLSENYANAMHLPWAAGAAVSLALNRDQFDDSRACGLCIMYRGIGGGIGVTPVSTTNWFMGIVNNICPECSRGDIDQNIDGDGRWKIEWYAVPCNVGDTKMRYDLVVKTYYWIAIVVSNTRIPVRSVSAKINGQWIDLMRSVTNQWQYHRENGDWAGSFPMPIRITSTMNETVEDVIQTADGNMGTKQFSAIPGPAYVSAGIPGRGYRPNNAFPLQNPGVAIPNMGPLKGAGANGVSGWNGEKQAALKPQIPTMAPSTTSDGVVFQADTLNVADYQQCGGTGGDCTARDRGQPVKPCIPGAWPLAVCSNDGSICQSVSSTQERFECKPSALAVGGGSSNSTSQGNSTSSGGSSTSAGSPSSSSTYSPSPSSSAPSSPTSPFGSGGSSPSSTYVASGGRRLMQL